MTKQNKTGKPGGRAGRPAFVFPEQAEQVIDGAAFAGSPDREIAALFGCSQATLKTHFQPILVKARARRRISIRTWQMNAAKKGVPALLIWLGKNELDQRDTFALELSDDQLKNLSTEQLEALAAGTAKTVRSGPGSKPDLKVSDGGRA